MIGLLASGRDLELASSPQLAAMSLAASSGTLDIVHRHEAWQDAPMLNVVDADRADMIWAIIENGADLHHLATVMTAFQALINMAH